MLNAFGPTISAKLLSIFPLNFLRSGYYYNGALNDRTQYGGWRSNAWKSSTADYLLNAYISSTKPQGDNGGNGSGFALRCGI